MQKYLAGPSTRAGLFKFQNKGDCLIGRPCKPPLDLEFYNTDGAEAQAGENIRQ